MSRMCGFDDDPEAEKRGRFQRELAHLERQIAFLQQCRDRLKAQMPPTDEEKSDVPA